MATLLIVFFCVHGVICSILTLACVLRHSKTKFEPVVSFRHCLMYNRWSSATKCTPI